MISFFTRWFSLSIAVAIVTAFMPGFTIVGEKVEAIVVFSLFMALINILIKPLVSILSLPITLLSCGLFSLILSVIFMRFASWLALTIFNSGVITGNFIQTLIASAIISLISYFINRLLS